MSRNERVIVEKIDRRREREQSRVDRTARQKALDARAASLVACEIIDLPEEDRADFAQSLAGAVRVQLMALHGNPTASSILSREAYEAGRDILPRKVAAAEAERLFARLPKAANDGDEA
ncbi:hypothetical protein [Brevundimonas sp. Root1279]|uniref:hypothetical protein n=1 Tax=Brevundimonas sp. Root1279 TaxID=1736443 RepID=UPI0006F720E6|nr:hypothetical protein [Brevundimonas sp. Root1279]KQW79733.1 hypothetical protein ASC65_14390 [Brevundimonas sp. Root1279]